MIKNQNFHLLWIIDTRIAITIMTKQHQHDHNCEDITRLCIYVTGPGKTGLIYTKYACLYYGTYLLFCMCYPTSVNYIKFLMDFCIYDDILDTIQITDKKLLQFKHSKSDQILCVDKTCFPRPSHI